RSEEDDGAHGWSVRYAGWPVCDEEAEEPAKGHGEEGPEQEPSFPATHEPPRHAGDAWNARDAGHGRWHAVHEGAQGAAGPAAPGDGGHRRGEDVRRRQEVASTFFASPLCGGGAPPAFATGG